MRGSDARVLKRFGRAVRAAREQRGLAQEALAEAAELSRNYISDIERGVRNPGLVAVIRVARALDTSVGELIADVESR